MRRHTDCLLIGRRWVGGRGAYSWVGILRLPMSINTSRLLRALPSRIWSFFYGGCKLWRLRQVPTTFTFFILRGYKASKGRQLQICKTTYVSRKNCSDSRPWSIFSWKLGWWAVRLYAACFKRMARELFLQRDGAVPTCLSATYTLRLHSLPPQTSSYIHFVRKSLHHVLNLHWSIEDKRCLSIFQSFSSGNHLSLI